MRRRKAIMVPSGDHVGSASLPALRSVSCTGGDDPSLGHCDSFNARVRRIERDELAAENGVRSLALCSDPGARSGKGRADRDQKNDKGRSRLRRSVMHVHRSPHHRSSSQLMCTSDRQRGISRLATWLPMCPAPMNPIVAVAIRNPPARTTVVSRAYVRTPHRTAPSRRRTRP